MFNYYKLPVGNMCRVKANQDKPVIFSKKRNLPRPRKFPGFSRLFPGFFPVSRVPKKIKKIISWATCLLNIELSFEGTHNFLGTPCTFQPCTKRKSLKCSSSKARSAMLAMHRSLAAGLHDGPNRNPQPVYVPS